MPDDPNILAKVRRVIERRLTGEIRGVTVAPGAHPTDVANELIAFALREILDAIGDASLTGDAARTEVEILKAKIVRLESDAFMAKDTISCQKSWLKQAHDVIVKTAKGEPLNGIDEIVLEGILQTAERAAQGIEAQGAETTGSACESPVGETDAPGGSL